MRSAICSLWRSARLSAPAAWLFCACVLLCLSWPMNAVEAPNSKLSLTQLQQASARLVENSAALLQRLISRERQLSNSQTRMLDLEKQLAEQTTELRALKAEIETLRQQSEELGALSQTQRQQLALTSTALARSQMMLSSSRLALDNFRKTAEAQVAVLERKVTIWRAVGVIGVIVAVLAGAVAVAK